MAYRINWEEDGLRTVWTGRVTSQEILGFQKKVQGDARFDDIRYSFHDFLGCTGADYSADEMSEAAALDRAGSLSNPRPIKIAVVAIDASVLAMIGCYLNARQSPHPLRFFACVSDAEEWIHRGV